MVVGAPIEFFQDRRKEKKKCESKRLKKKKRKPKKDALKRNESLECFLCGNWINFIIKVKVYLICIICVSHAIIKRSSNRYN